MIQYLTKPNFIYEQVNEDLDELDLGMDKKKKKPKKPKEEGSRSSLWVCMHIYRYTHTLIRTHTHAHKHTGEEGGAVKSGGGANAGELGPNDIYPV